MVRNILTSWCSYMSGRPYRTLVGGRGKECIFWGSQKMLPQRDFATGRFPLAGVWKAATPETTSESQVPGNGLPVFDNPSGQLFRHEHERGDFSQPALLQ